MPILHPKLYEAVYARVGNVLNSVTSRSARSRNHVYRGGDFRDVKDTGLAGADKFRTVRESSTDDGNRWTGPRAHGVTKPKPAAGGIYTSLGLADAWLGEFAFYAFGTTVDEDVQRMLRGEPTLLSPATFPAAFATKRLFEYEFPVSLRIADLSLSGQGGRELLRAIETDAFVKAQLTRAGYGNVRQAYLANLDHTLPRAISHAVRDLMPGYQAIWVSSARAGSAVQMRDDEGDNIVFYGADHSKIEYLRPVREIAFAQLPNGKYKEGVTYF